MKKSEIDKVEVLDPNATLDIEKVIGWDKNAREIHPKDFERLKVQIVELGDYKPIIVEKTAEGFTALGGNMRLKAYRELGYKKVWAIVVKPKDDEQRLKLALSDNDRAGYYIADLLAENLKNVNFKNLSDYKVDIRIPDIDMTDILDRAMKSVENEDNVPAVRETSIKIGDMFNLGQHRLLCGDSTLQANVERLMGGKKADMVITDPPYGIGFKYNEYKDEKGAVYEQFCDKWFNCISDIDIKVIFTGWNYNKFWFNKDPYDVFYWIVKSKHSGGKNSHFRNTEPILIWGRFKEQFDFDFILDNAIERLKGPADIHTCPKPVKMFTDFITHSTKTGVNVLDIFLGSGTTLIACELTDRICYGMELDPVYCQVIIDRWEDFTGKKAEVLI